MQVGKRPDGNHAGVRVVSDVSDPGFKLNGITYGKVAVAIINGKSLAEGDTAMIPLKPTPLAVKCLKIETNTVLISVQGEETPRRLLRSKSSTLVAVSSSLRKHCISESLDSTATRA